MPFAHVNGISLYYELTGTGERLLFISGTGSDLRHHRPADGPLAEHFEVLAYDQRGLGQSDVPEGPYTMAGYGDDAAALIEAAGWPDCLVVGMSFGGMVAQELAIHHPERVRRLVLACTSSGGRGGSSYPLHELADLDPDARLTRQLEIMDTRWDAAWREANPGTVRLISSALNQTGDAKDSAVGPGPRLQLEARRHHDTAERLDQIRCPTLVCGGRFDGIAPPANSEFLAKAIPGAQLAMFDGGHAFVMQDPAAIPAIIAFLGDAPPGGAGAGDAVADATP